MKGTVSIQHRTVVGQFSFALKNVDGVDYVYLRTAIDQEMFYGGTGDFPKIFGFEGCLRLENKEWLSTGPFVYAPAGHSSYTRNRNLDLLIMQAWKKFYRDNPGLFFKFYMLRDWLDGLVK